jgi:hypothetical protein
MVVATFLRAVVLPMAALLGQPILVDHDHSRPNVDGPAVQLAQRTFDMGTLLQGEMGSITIPVGNRGTADLVIKDIATSCGCTAVDLTEADRTIPPGETRTLTVHYDSTGRFGRQPNVVALLTNDTAQPEVRLLVTARVEALFRVTPEPLVNVQGARRGVALAPVEIFPTRQGAVLQDVTVQMPPGLLDYEREEITNSNGVNGVRLIPRVPSEIELGDIESEFLVKGVVDGVPAEVHVRVTGAIVGELRAIPSTLQSLSMTMRGHSFAPVTVESTTGRPFQVISADAGPYVEVTTKRARDNEWIIQAKLKDNAPDGPYATTLRLRTDSTGQPQFEIPIFVRIRPRFLVEPSMVALGPLTENRGRTVRIQGESAAAMKFRELRGDDARIVAKVEKVGQTQPNVILIRIALRDGDPPSEDFSTRVVLVPEASESAELVIPVEYVAPR